MLMNNWEIKKLSKFLVPNCSLLLSQLSTIAVYPERSRRTWEDIIKMDL